MEPHPINKGTGEIPIGHLRRRVASLRARIAMWRVRSRADRLALSHASRPHGKLRGARTALIWGVLAVAALHLGLLALVERNPAIRDPLHGRRVAWLEQRMRSEPEALKVVMIGTSRTGNDFDAAGLERSLRDELKRPVITLNFGIPGNGPIFYQLHLRRMLQQGIKPDLLLLEVLPLLCLDIGDEPFEAHVVKLQADRVRQEEKPLLERYGIPTEPVDAAETRFLTNPWDALRFQILLRVRKNLVPPDVVWTADATSDPWFWRPIPLETVAAADYAKYRERAYLEHGRALGTFRFGRPALKALTDLLDLCRDEGIPVVLIHLPEGTDYRCWYTPESKKLIERTLSEIAVKHGGTFVDATDWVPDGFFFDSHHLLRRGAEWFTKRLGNDVVLPRLRNWSASTHGKSDGDR